MELTEFMVEAIFGIHGLIWLVTHFIRQQGKAGHGVKNGSNLMMALHGLYLLEAMESHNT